MLRKSIVTDHGHTLLVEDTTEEQLAQLARRFYEGIGGAEFFHRLAARFYQLVAVDSTIGTMFPRTPEEHARGLADHFIRMYGTPDLSEGWDPAFLRAHLRHVIGDRHRARWLELMRDAGTDIAAPEPWFSDFIATLTTGSRAISAASRGAALARGTRIDRAGEIVENAAAPPPIVYSPKEKP